MLLVSVLSGTSWGDVVHGLHHALLVVGLALVTVLACAPWVAARRGRLRTAEERRVAALREAASEGVLGSRLLVDEPTWATATEPAGADRMSVRPRGWSP